MEDESKWDSELIERLTEVMHDTFVREANGEVTHPFSELEEGDLKEWHRKACMATLDAYIDSWSDEAKVYMSTPQLR